MTIQAPPLTFALHGDMQLPFYYFLYVMMVIEEMLKLSLSNDDISEIWQGS